MMCARTSTLRCEFCACAAGPMGSRVRRRRAMRASARGMVLEWDEGFEGVDFGGPEGVVGGFED